MPLSSLLFPALELSWTAELTLSRVEGEAPAVLAALGRPANVLLGQPLHTVLGVDEARARALDTAAREKPGQVEFFTAKPSGVEGVVPLRLTLGRDSEGRSAAGVISLDTLLQGAPVLPLWKLTSPLAHELRNPLSSVKMAVQTLARNPGLNDRDKRRLSIANREVRTLERMLWLLSEYGREGTTPLELVSMGAVIEEAAALVSLELAERTSTIQVVTEGEPAKVRLDAVRFRPVLSQVLLNAALGHPEGAAVPVTVKPLANGGVSVELVDPEAVLAPGEEPQLFEPFGHRLSRSAGLTLSALRRALARHGGHATASPEPTGGVRLALHLAP